MLLNLRTMPAYLELPLVSDEQVVGGEIAVQHVSEVHELNGSGCLMRQLQPLNPTVVQLPARTSLQGGTSEMLSADSSCRLLRNPCSTTSLLPEP
jgi:hypothetical protein